MSYLTLTDNDKKITQPNSIKIELMNHQKTMVHKMMEIEDTGIIKIKNYEIPPYSNLINIFSNEAEINTNIGILGDKVGSGKTLMIITLLTISKNILSRDIELGGTQFYSVKIKPSSVLVKSNLIIVPHKLLPQWKEAFQKYSPTLKILTISLNKEINALRKVQKEIKKNWRNEFYEIETEILETDKLDDIDVVLIGETMYKRFYKVCENIRFNRILIDEADTIKLPRDMNCQFNFLWFITGTPSGLFYNNKSFINKIFKENTLNVNSNFVIKNDDNFIDKSIILPHPKRFKVKCITPIELNLIKDLIPPSILQMINAGNSDQAIKTLNCNIDTNDNILQVITKNLRDSISNKKIELEAEKKKYYPVNLKKEHELKIKLIENQIDKLVNKYEDIKKKIYDLNDTNCPVCMGEFTNPVIVNCCKNMFCFDCLAVSMGELKNNKCPYCTQKIAKTDIHIFQNDDINKIKNTSLLSNDSNKYETKEKLDVLLDLVKKKPDGSFMIFAGFQETFNKIEVKLKEENITYHILKGQSSVVKKSIDDFREKKVRILMLNSQFFGAGMNLQMATDIIIYHRFTKEMEEQIIGRAQRLGRDIHSPLNVYYLLHDNESNNIEDKFKFEDKNMHYLDWLEKEKQEKQDIKINNINNISADKIYTIDMENSDYDNYDKPDMFEYRNKNSNQEEKIIVKAKSNNNFDSKTDLDIILNHEENTDDINSEIFIKQSNHIHNIENFDIDNFDIDNFDIILK